MSFSSLNKSKSSFPKDINYYLSPRGQKIIGKQKLHIIFGSGLVSQYVVNNIMHTMQSIVLFKITEFINGSRLRVINKKLLKKKITTQMKKKIQQRL